MRSVFVFPMISRDETIATLDRHFPGQRHPWIMDDSLYFHLEDETNGVLFTDWEPEDVQSVEAALGFHPSWAVRIDVSGRIDGTSELKQAVELLLKGGGVALDDYSSHPWTLSEITSGAVRGGLRFFDVRGHRAPRPVFASKLYWEQRPTYSAPVLLLLDEDHVELVTDEGAGLSCAVSELVVHRALGRFTIEHGGQSFQLTSREGRTSPPMMPATTRRLRRFEASHPDMPEPSNQRLVSQWVEYLDAAGAELRGPTPERLRRITIAMFAAPLVILALVFGAYLLGVRPY